MKSPFKEIIKELLMWKLRCDADHNTLWHQGFISGINEALETVRRHKWAFDNQVLFESWDAAREEGKYAILDGNADLMARGKTPLQTIRSAMAKEKESKT